MNEVLNQDFNIQLMKLLENEDDDDVCLIDGMPLDPNCIELVCTHKFNYLMNCLTNMCEGDKTILDVAIHADLPFRLVENYVNLWVKKKLLKITWKHPFIK